MRISEQIGPAAKERTFGKAKEASRSVAKQSSGASSTAPDPKRKRARVERKKTFEFNFSLITGF